MKSILLTSTAMMAVLTGICQAANIISTFDGGGATPFAWSLDTNWNHNPASPGNFPKNGMGGNNYSVIINADRADLSEDITIDGLTMTNSAEIKTGGRVLTVVQPATLAGGIFSGGGTITLSTLNATGGLTTSGAGTSVSATATTLGVVGGGAGSVTFLGGGGFVNAGTFTIVNNGTLSSGAGGGTFHNQGSLSKTGSGGGLSTVSATFDGSSGTVSVSDGELRFTGSSAWGGGLGAAVNVSNGAILRLSGNSGIGTLNITLTTGTSFQFSGGAHTLFGTLTSTGDIGAQVLYANTLGKISGGTLDLDAMAPFVSESGELGTDGTVTNEGAFTWKGGVITGGGISNTGATAGLFTVPASLLARIIRGGSLSNAGHITQSDGSMSLGNDGVLHNLPGATYLCTGTAIFTVESGATTHLIDNEGTWRKTGTASSTVFTRFKNSDALQIQGGTLTLRGANEFTGLGTIQVDRTTDAAARLIIGGAGLASTYDSPFFNVIAGGVIELSSGTHTLSGTATLSGTGKVEQTSGTVVVPGGGGAISGPASAPFRINGSLSKVQTNGTLTNNGLIEWPQGILIGPGKLVNAAGSQIWVGGNARLSDSPAGSMAQIENHGIIQLEEAGLLSVGEDGILVNETGGRVNLPGTSDISKIVPTTGGEIQNKGVVVKTPLPGGSLASGSIISTEFIQNVPTASLGSESGILHLNGGVDIQTGVVFSRNLNGAGSKTQFSNGAGFTSVAFEFQNGGIIEFNAGSHVFQGASTFTGSGTAQLLVGTLSAPPGGSGTLSIGGGAVFQQTSGALGQDGDLFIEQGTFQKTGGTTGGRVTSRNGAAFIMNGGSIGGSFTNRAAFDWQSGSIGGQFVNHAEGITAADTAKITTANVHTVSGGTTLTNHGLLRHQSAGQVSLGAGAAIANQFEGIYEFTAGGTVSHGGGGATTSMFNNSGTVRVVTAGVTATVSTGLTNTTSGRLTATAGTLRLTGQTAINGGGLDASTGGIVEITKGAVSGSISHAMSGGVVMYNNTAGAGQLTINASLTSSGTGEVLFAGSTDVPSSSLATLVFAPAASGRLTGVIRVDGALTNSRALTIAGGTIIAQNGGVFTNDTTGFTGNENSLFIAGSGSTTWDATGTGPQFVNKGRITHINTGALLLNRQAVLINQDDYSFEGDGDILPGGSATQIAFVNKQTLSKFTGTGVSDITVPFDNQDGNVFALSGTLRFTDAEQFNGFRLSGGRWTVATGGTLNLVSGTITENDAYITVRGSGVFVNLPTSSSMSSFQNDGSLTLDTNADLNFGSGLFQNNGDVRIGAGCTLRTGPFSTGQFGTLTSSGTLQSNVTQNGTLAPGNSPGEFTIDGILIQGSTGILDIELDGTNPGVTYDKVTVTGAVTLGGQLRVTVLSGGIGLPAGSTFTILTGSSVTGTFATLDLPKDTSGSPLFSVQYNPASVVLTALGPVQPAQIQSWRLQFFGSSANSGDGADLNDFDDDGLANLLEYALGDDPTVSSRDSLPDADTSTGRLGLNFTRFVEKTDITITVQASETLSGPWTDLARSTAGGVTTALLGGVTVTETGSGETRAVTVEDAFTMDDSAHPWRFLRLQVTRP